MNNHYRFLVFKEIIIFSPIIKRVRKSTFLRQKRREEGLESPFLSILTQAASDKRLYVYPINLFKDNHDFLFVDIDFYKFYT